MREHHDASSSSKGAKAQGAKSSDLDAASVLLAALSEQPEQFLDTTDAAVQKVAGDARRLTKFFFDAVQTHCPYSRIARAGELESGIDSLVIDGFDHAQIWEELELQNIPLRRYLQRHVSKLATVPTGAINLSLNQLSGPVEPELSEPHAVPERQASLPKAKKASKKAKKVVEPAEEDEETGEEAEGETLDAKGRSGKLGLDDAFFKLEDMQKFADDADAGKVTFEDGDDAESGSDAGNLMFQEEDGGSDEEDAGRDVMYSDFFEPSAGQETDGKDGKKSSRRKRAEPAETGDMEDEAADEGEEEEEEDAEGDEPMEGEDEHLEAEERQLEEQLRRLQEEGEEGGMSEEEEEEVAPGEADGDEDEGNEEASEGGEADGQKPARGDATTAASRSLYEMDKHLQALDEEVAKLEEEQLEEKHWSLQGEVSAKQRPLNSLLEMALDQPMTHFAARRASEEAVAAGVDMDEPGETGLDDVPGADGLFKGAAKFDIEQVIKQRVWDETYDDVIKKDVLPPSKRPKGEGEEDAVEVLNFEKSRVGLGDIYAKQYEAEMLNHKTQQEEKEDEQKTAVKQLFGKLMHKLDMLTNAHFTPRPPMQGFSGEAMAKVPSLKMEETIPLMVSDALMKAPEEVRRPMKHIKASEELSHEERKAVRRNSKARRKKVLEGRVEAGDLTTAGVRERAAKLQQKNAELKKAAAEKGQIKERKQKLKASELLSQAAKNAASGQTRKEVIREEREKQQKAKVTVASKKLKL